jgi:hypothetical protein
LHRGAGSGRVRRPECSDGLSLLVEIGDRAAGLGLHCRRDGLRSLLGSLDCRPGGYGTHRPFDTCRGRTRSCRGSTGIEEPACLLGQGARPLANDCLTCRVSTDFRLDCGHQGYERVICKIVAPGIDIDGEMLLLELALQALQEECLAGTPVSVQVQHIGAALAALGEFAAAFAQKEFDDARIAPSLQVIAFPMVLVHCALPVSQRHYSRHQPVRKRGWIRWRQAVGRDAGFAFNVWTVGLAAGSPGKPAECDRAGGTLHWPRQGALGTHSRSKPV